MLTEEQGKLLVAFARHSIAAAVAQCPLPTCPSTDPVFLERRGVFVTLRKARALRGCIGYLEGTESLWEMARQAAVHAALHDQRFPPVRASELSAITIEVSVLSDFIKINSVDEVLLGQHGVFLRQGFSTAVFLPDVPVEFGWDLQTYLAELSMKAGLEADAWRDAATEIYLFTSQQVTE